MANREYSSKAKRDLEGYKPYESQYADSLKGLYDQIMNREDFTYDLNSDALYNQYKQQYVRQGKLAMQDTLGQASALTGGYGNSYASTAGNQAYQSYLTGLNDKVPELYQLAYDAYNQKGADMLNRYGVAQGADESAYGRWMDEYTRLVDKYNREYGEYRDHVSDEQWQADYNYRAERDAVEDARYQQEWEYQVQQDALNRAAAAARSSGSGGGGSSGYSSPASSATVDENIVRIVQQSVDGGESMDDILRYLQRHYSNETIAKTFAAKGWSL